MLGELQEAGASHSAASSGAVWYSRPGKGVIKYLSAWLWSKTELSYHLLGLWSGACSLISLDFSSFICKMQITTVCTLWDYDDHDD